MEKEFYKFMAIEIGRIILFFTLTWLLVGLPCKKISEEMKKKQEEMLQASTIIEYKETFTKYGTPTYIIIYRNNITGEYWKTEVDTDTYYKLKNEDIKPKYK